MLRDHVLAVSDRINAGLPSSDSAAAFLAGEQGSTGRFVSSTALRSLLIFPGLLVAGIEWRRALLGSLLGSIGISTFILIYMSARNTTRSPVQMRGALPPHRREGIPGGRAAGMSPRQFPRAQLKRGLRVELEHTDDPEVALEIAMDHLAEDPRYYTKLATIHAD